MPSVKDGLSSCCKVTLRTLEERLELARSALPTCFACCPQKRLLVLIFSFWVSAARLAVSLSPASPPLAMTLHHTVPKSHETRVAINE